MRKPYQRLRGPQTIYNLADLDMYQGEAPVEFVLPRLEDAVTMKRRMRGTTPVVFAGFPPGAISNYLPTYLGVQLAGQSTPPR